MFRAMSTALVFLGVMAPLALASTVLRLSPEELADRAEIAFHGTVTSMSCRKLADGDIVTDFQVEVHEFLKGAQGKTFTFTTYGGVVGGRGSLIAGAPKFKVEEEILLFLGKINRVGCRMPVGLAQGKYSIRTVEGKRVAIRDMEGLRLMDAKTGQVKDAKAEQGVPFDELLATIKKHLASTAQSNEDGDGR